MPAGLLGSGIVRGEAATGEDVGEAILGRGVLGGDAASEEVEGLLG